MSAETIAPAINRRVFTCPHCRETIEQVWFNLYADRVNNEQGLPLRLTAADLQRLRDNPTFSEAKREQVVNYWERVTAGEVFLDRWAPAYSEIFVANLALSACTACQQSAVWIRDQMVHPDQT